MLAIFQSVLSRRSGGASRPRRAPPLAAPPPPPPMTTTMTTPRAAGGTPRRLADGFGSPPGASPRERTHARRRCIRRAAAHARAGGAGRQGAGGAAAVGCVLAGLRRCATSGSCRKRLELTPGIESAALPTATVTEPLARRLAANAAVPLDQYLNLRPC
jgi:hypothetical protein